MARQFSTTDKRCRSDDIKSEVIQGPDSELSSAHPAFIIIL